MLQNGNCAKVFADVLHLFIYFPSKYKLVAAQRLVCVGHALVMGVPSLPFVDQRFQYLSRKLSSSTSWGVQP